jgi:hypothetical protein
VSRAQATGARERYASALSGLWDGLAATLARLEAIAADPYEQLDEEALQVLPTLQYALHRAEELAVGIQPPLGAEATHRELRRALACARDVTGQVLDRAQADGVEAAAALAAEWRGALFRVRLARRRLTEAEEPASAARKEEGEGGGAGAAALATAVVVAGTAAFTAGAVLALWPLWAFGLLLVALAFLVYR